MGSATVMVFSFLLLVGCLVFMGFIGVYGIAVWDIWGTNFQHEQSHCNGVMFSVKCVENMSMSRAIAMVCFFTLSHL